MTTPGEPRSMRKLATASNTEGSARNESCSHEAGTVFYAIVDGRYQLRDCKASVLAQKIRRPIPASLQNLPSSLCQRGLAFHEVFHDLTLTQENEKFELRHAGMDSRHPDSQGCVLRHPCQSGFQRSMLE